MSAFAARFLSRCSALPPHVPVFHKVTLQQGELKATPVSHEHCMRAISAACRMLKALDHPPGRTVALSVSDPLEFLALFLASQCLGLIPVPLPPSNALNRKAYVARVLSVIDDCMPATLFVDRTRREQIDAAMGDQTHVVALDPDTNTADAWLLPETGLCTHDGPAFLQYTSGSTGAPKGVVITHRNLQHNLDAMVDAFELTASDVSFSWLPLFHDMGLVGGLLLGLWTGIPTYLAAPSMFMQRPLSWLRGISTYRATISFAPNFAYETMMRRCRLEDLGAMDLSSWRIAVNGAEPVRPSTVRGFIERFASTGFSARALRAAYGLAEATLTVTMAREHGPRTVMCVSSKRLVHDRVAAACASSEQDAVELVSLGRPITDQAVEIRDPQTQELVPDGQVGEIVVSGACVSPGYYAYLRSGAPPRTSLRTGDLGFMLQHELYVVDRLKDLIIVRGRNYSPVAIEHGLAEATGLMSGLIVAFGVEVEGTECLCIAAGVPSREPSHLAELERLIYATVYERHELVLGRVFLVAPTELPRTTSGKLMRMACRSKFFGVGSAADAQAARAADCGGVANCDE